jgi:hypothetical protein
MLRCLCYLQRAGKIIKGKPHKHITGKSNRGNQRNKTVMLCFTEIAAGKNQDTPANRNAVPTTQYENLIKVSHCTIQEKNIRIVITIYLL